MERREKDFNKLRSSRRKVRLKRRVREQRATQLEEENLLHQRVIKSKNKQTKKE